MDQSLFLSYHKLHHIYLLAVNSAVLLFLTFFLVTLLNRGKRGIILKPVSSPSRLWQLLNFLYPAWFDRLTFGQIFLGFAWALGSAAVCWMILVVLFLVVMAKVYGP